MMKRRRLRSYATATQLNLVIAMTAACASMNERGGGNPKTDGSARIVDQKQSSGLDPGSPERLKWPARVVITPLKEAGVGADQAERERLEHLIARTLDPWYLDGVVTSGDVQTMNEHRVKNSVDGVNGVGTAEERRQAEASDIVVTGTAGDGQVQLTFVNAAKDRVVARVSTQADRLEEALVRQMHRPRMPSGEQLTRVISTKQQNIDTCIEEDRPPAGTYGLSITYGRDGAIKGAEFTKTEGATPAATRRCMEAVLQSCGLHARLADEVYFYHEMEVSAEGWRLRTAQASE